MEDSPLAVVARYGKALIDNLPQVTIVTLAGLTWIGLRRWRPRPSGPAWLPRAAIAVVAVLAIAWAWHLRWFADDAFISFRYARNWSDGNGLVFNAGERVEGYTNFLWTALLAGGDRIGLDIPTLAIALCLASHVGAIVVTTRLVRRLAPAGDPVVVSLAAIAVATSYVMASFATGGLETTFATVLVMLAIDRACAGALLTAGTAGIAAVLARPDHAIFYVAIGAVLALRRAPWRQLARYAAPFVVLYVPYFIARWSYYGLLLPNTYYAKTSGGAYFHQGVMYLFASAVGAGMTAVVPLAIYGLVTRRRELAAQVVAIAAPVYLVYLAKIGGDFMFGRMLVPLMPLIFVFAEIGLRELVAAKRWRTAVAAIVAAGLACVPTRIIKPREMAWYLTDERTMFPLDSLDRIEPPHRIAVLRRYLGAVGAPPAYAAYAIGVVGWVTSWRIVDIHGLTDPDLAQAPLEDRGRPGHEHVATAEHLLARGTDLSALPLYPKPYDHLARLELEGELFHLARYRAEWLDPLRRDPRVMFVWFPDFIDQYTAAAGNKTQQDLEQHLDFFDHFYFAAYPDPVRRARLVAAIAAAK
jgi:arabinofuranosyltransferase